MESEGKEPIEVELADAGSVGELRELWLELHHHHAAVAPQSGEFTDDETSWRYRSAAYREWLDDPRSFLLIARRRTDPVAYALVRVFENSAHELDSWRVPEIAAELETIVVTSSARGAGLGERLLDRVDAELDRRGITELVVGVIPGNDGARRLYERRGFRPRWLELVRSAKRDP